MPLQSHLASLVLQTSSTFRSARNNQPPHKELWGPPGFPTPASTPISESCLAGRGILFLHKQQSGAPVPWLPRSQSQPPACCPPPQEMRPRDSALGQEKAWRLQRKVEEGASGPPAPPGPCSLREDPNSPNYSFQVPTKPPTSSQGPSREREAATLCSLSSRPGGGQPRVSEQASEFGEPLPKPQE